jgi:hypothetical protein
MSIMVPVIGSVAVTSGVIREGLGSPYLLLLDEWFDVVDDLWLTLFQERDERLVVKQSIGR